MGLLIKNTKTSSGRAELFLPCHPHFFINIISSNLNEEYNISYLEECDISTDNHRLPTATESVDHILISTQFEIKINM